MSRLIIVIPMAGEGKPFKDAGYTFPKPLIDIHGRTMIEVVVKNLTPKIPHTFVFVCKKEHIERYDLANILRQQTGQQCYFVALTGNTQGAACSVLSAIEYIDKEAQLLIANADQWIDYSINDFIDEANDRKLDGLILTFPSTHPRWSYVRLDKSGVVIEAEEKKVVSSHATVGLYYFRKGKYFIDAAQQMILKNIRHRQEFFVCPSYNEMILSGKQIGVREISIDQIYGLGTPEELHKFQEALINKKVQI